MYTVQYQGFIVVFFIYLAKPFSMRYLVVLYLFTSLDTVSLSAQTHRFSPGFMIKQNGDTLNGLFYWRKYAESYDSLYYKPSADSPEQAMAWPAVQYAARTGKDEVYIQTMKRILDYLDPNTFNIRMKDSSRVETIPLTPIFKGKVLTLYLFRGDADFYFISDSSGKAVQLIQTYRYLTPREQMFYLTQVPKYMINYEYRNQLMMYYNFDSDRKMADLLERTLYQEVSLKTLVKKMDSKLVSVR